MSGEISEAKAIAITLHAPRKHLPSPSPGQALRPETKPSPSLT